MSVLQEIQAARRRFEKPSSEEQSPVSTLDAIRSLRQDLVDGSEITELGQAPVEAGFEAGIKGLQSSKQTAAAAFNYLTDDPEAAKQNLVEADKLDGQAGRIGQHLASFEDFIEDPGFSNFAEMSAFKLGQAAPSAIESLALATAGAAVGLTTTGVGAVPGLVGGLVAKGKAKRMVRDAVLDYAKGEASDEQAEVAQQALKLGARAAFGAKAGAASGGYYQGVASSFSESMETGQDPIEAAKLAAVMGVPFAAADVAPEILFVKSLAKLAKSSKGSAMGDFASSTLKQGGAETFAEGSQESLIVAQRFQQDPNYDSDRAIMRIADAAYSGLVGGSAIGTTSGSVKAALTAARNMLNDTRKTMDAFGPAPREGRTFTPEADEASDTGPAPREGRTFTPEADEASDTGPTVNSFEFEDTSPEGMAKAPLNELLYAAKDAQDGETLAADPTTQEHAAAAIQELNRRSEEMGQNRFQELVRRELQQGSTQPENDQSEVDQEIFNETDLPEAGATEQRTADGELSEQPQGFEERLLGKNTKGDGYVPGSRAIRTRLKKLQEENPGLQYRLVQKDGTEFIEEVVESSFDVSQIINEGVTKARAGTKEGGKDRTLPATDPQGKDINLSPVELAYAGMRANNKDKANASSMTYPQLLMSGFLRMNQELADKGFKINLDTLPDSTVIAKANGKAYTWGDLKKAWAKRADTKEGSAFDGKAAKEDALISTEEQIDKLITELEALDPDLQGRAAQASAELDIAEASREDQANVLEQNEEVETDTIAMGEAQAQQDAKKTRTVDENGNPINYSTRKGTKPKATPKPKPKPKATPKPKPKPKPAQKSAPVKERVIGKVSVWGSFPDVFANYANAIIAAVGIKKKVNILWAEDADAFFEQNPGVIDGAVINKATEGKQRAMVYQLDDVAYIFIKKDLGNDYRIANTAAILGHELGHILYRESIDNMSEANLARLQKAYQEQLKTKSNKQYTNDDQGFQEWYSDQVSAWAAKQTKTPTKFAESHFKRVAAKMQTLWRKARQFVRQNIRSLSPEARESLRTMKDRFTLDETFEQYMESVLNSVNGAQSRSEPNWRYANKTDSAKNNYNRMKDDFLNKVGSIEGKPLLTKLMEAMKDIWNSSLFDGLAKVLFSADQYARSRLGQYGPAFANLFYHRTQSAKDAMGDMLNKSHRALDKWNAQFSEIIGKDQDISRKVLEEMQSGVPINESVDPKMRQKLADFFDRFHSDYLVKRIPGIGKVQNYFPIVYNIAALQGNPDAFLAELAKAGLNPKEAQTVMRAMLDNDGAFTEEMPNPELVGPSFDSKLQRKLKNIDMQAMQKLGFYQDPMLAVQLYLKQATKHAEYNVIKKQAEELINKMPPKQRAHARQIVLGYMGRLGADIDPKWNKFQSYIAALQFATTLLFATVASFTDLGNPIVRAKDMDGFKSALRNWRKYMSKQSREEMTQFAERIGAASREAVQDALHQAYNSEYIDPGARKWSDKYFKAIGLEHWTRMTRIIAANMARDFIATHTKKAAAGDVRSLRYLKELGLTPEIVAKGFDIENDSMDLTTPEGEAVQNAILQFVDEAIIRPNAAQRPVWASDPHYMLIWQLKSFFYSFGQVVVGGVAREMQSRWAEGDRAKAAIPAIVLFGALLPLAALALQTRELIKGAFKDDEREKPEEETISYLFDLVDRAGILGPLSIVKSINDAGNYGRSGIVAALGPTAGTIETFLDEDMGNLVKRLTPIYSQL